MRENGFLGASKQYARSIVFLYVIYLLLLGFIAVNAYAFLT